MLEEFPSLNKESLNRLISFRDISKGCLPLLTKSMERLQERFSNEKNIPTWIFLCFDVLKRIRENIFFISESHPPQTNTTIPLKLCIRSVFSDLILGLFALSHAKDEDRISQLVDSLDYAALEGKIKSAECEIEFYKHAPEPVYSEFLASKIHLLKCSIDGIRNKYASSKPNTIKSWSSISNMAQSLKNNNDETISCCYCALYGPFKLLSQTEHYAPSNRHESYFNCSTDPFFFHKYALQYAYAIKIFCEHINSLCKKI